MITTPESDSQLLEARVAYSEGSVTKTEMLCRRHLRKHPTDAGALHLLALIHAARGDDAEAVRLLRQSLAYAPDNSEAWCDLATACHKCRLSADAIQHLIRAISIQPDCYRAYGLLATLYYELGRNSEAASLYRDWLSKDPTDVEVHHMMLATTRRDPVPRCSEAFVRVHFDNCAHVFDERLVDQLGYRGHEMVAGALGRYTLPAADGGNAVLDAGCGTGLCGPLIRPHCDRLIGVDLSAKMIERARARGVYDELIMSELCAFMASSPDAFTAIVSSDVLIYFGDLDQVVKSAYRALRPEGILTVTLESLLDSSSHSYRLEVHGRYSHRDSYAMDVLSRAGFKLLHLGRETIRFELGKEVSGLLVVARKPI